MLSVSPKQMNSDGPSCTAVASDDVCNAVTLHPDGNPIFKGSLPLNIPDAADLLVAYSTAPGENYVHWYILWNYYTVNTLIQAGYRM